MKTVALIVAGGRGVRFGGDIPKQFRNILDRPLLSWTILQFEKAEKVDDIVVVVPEDFLLYTNEKVINPFQFKKVSQVVVGGASRSESVMCGLKILPPATAYIAIHDGARPLVYHKDIDRVIAMAHRERAAILARPIADTVKRVESDYVLSTLDRTKLYLAETPQVFRYDLIMTAYNKLSSGATVTDDACFVEQQGYKIRTVIPERINIKVTTEDDLILAKHLLKEAYEAGH
ncbi:MAG: 2-C-methyl-D-erythritol 4-phosphate cytidylyltransferase [candidate division Zixibacteria bacterium]|nr:2-C-methyl-D-erythritol 4-phosphate cytidylyltransferase [candidate division Zixibacteria bacterium]